MTEPILTASVISILVIIGAKTVYTVVRRVKKSKCVDSKGRTVEINMGNGDSNSSLSTTECNKKGDNRHRKKRHRHHRHREPLKRKNPKKNMSNNNNKDENK